jgi:hypothetical protein
MPKSARILAFKLLNAACSGASQTSHFIQPQTKKFRELDRENAAARHGPPQHCTVMSKAALLMADHPRDYVISPAR